ncbi:glycosyltransferase [Halorubrum ezzemoulense]|uniref:glycosyltransferase n=1 Tax=Halorubrum ezzemoulense TaxID=337243 RepID=UPI00232B067F|nr:glycosyltransferase [Halorubrum ezzemoulense]MDB2248608.1 glycosyltransferase [Halorubrum ezzemoulense]
MIDLSFIIGNLNKEHGGAQQLLFDICRNLPESGYNKTVYYMFGKGTYQEQFEEHGTTVIDLCASSNYDPLAFSRLVQYLRSKDIDILHTNSPISGFWGRSAAIFGDVPNIVSVEHNVHTEYSKSTQVVNGLSLSLADAVVGVSQAVSNSYLSWEQKLFGDSTRQVTIRNGVDLMAIRKTFDRSNNVLNEFTPFSPSDHIIGTVGRLHEQKGYEYLIQAFPQIKEQVTDVKLLILGDGPKRETLQALAKETGYSGDIHFTGYVPEVYPFLPNFDIAVFPSRWEGFGLTPVESMAAERPVVGTNIPPFREVIGDSGVLVEPESEIELARAIASLLEDPERQRELGRKGYERVLNKFSIERTVQEYMELYQDIISK